MARRGIRFAMFAILATLSIGSSAAGLACSASPSFDRSKAIDDVVARSGGVVNRGQAECYVDRVVQALGAGVLESTEANPEHIPKLTSIRIDCMGLAGLGSLPPTSVTVTTADGSGITQPRKPGDDPALDHLYAACGAGNGASCDQLFDLAALGSEYEEFASTCGGRTREVRCADVYPAPRTSATTG